MATYQSVRAPKNNRVLRTPGVGASYGRSRQRAQPYQPLQPPVPPMQGQPQPAAPPSGQQYPGLETDDLYMPSPNYAPGRPPIIGGPHYEPGHRPPVQPSPPPTIPENPSFGGPDIGNVDPNLQWGIQGPTTRELLRPQPQQPQQLPFMLPQMPHPPQQPQPELIAPQQQLQPPVQQPFPSWMTGGEQQPVSAVPHFSERMAPPTGSMFNKTWPQPPSQPEQQPEQPVSQEIQDQTSQFMQYAQSIAPHLNMQQRLQQGQYVPPMAGPTPNQTLQQGQYVAPAGTMTHAQAISQGIPGTPPRDESGFLDEVRKRAERKVLLDKIVSGQSQQGGFGSSARIANWKRIAEKNRLPQNRWEKLGMDNKQARRFLAGDTTEIPAGMSMKDALAAGFSKYNQPRGIRDEIPPILGKTPEQIAAGRKRHEDKLAAQRPAYRAKREARKARIGGMKQRRADFATVKRLRAAGIRFIPSDLVRRLAGVGGGVAGKGTATAALKELKRPFADPSGNEIPDTGSSMGTIENVAGKVDDKNLRSFYIDAALSEKMGVTGLP